MLHSTEAYVSIVSPTSKFFRAAPPDDSRRSPPAKAIRLPVLRVPPRPKRAGALLLRSDRGHTSARTTCRPLGSTGGARRRNAISATGPCRACRFMRVWHVRMARATADPSGETLRHAAASKDPAASPGPSRSHRPDPLPRSARLGQAL